MTDDELIEYAKIAVGCEHGLSPPQSRRLVGSTLKELHADAATMAGELGVEDPYAPEPVQTRDDGGRFAHWRSNTRVSNNSSRVRSSAPCHHDPRREAVSLGLHHRHRVLRTPQPGCPLGH